MAFWLLFPITIGIKTAVLRCFDGFGSVLLMKGGGGGFDGLCYVSVI